MATNPEATATQVLAELEKLGKESHRKTYIRHGAPADSIYGVPIADLKPFQKRFNKDQRMALDLYATGNSDAMYLAGLIADAGQMKQADLNRWAREATWGMISASAVAGVAADSPHAVALGSRWIDAKQERVAVAGWSTLSGYLSVCADEQIDLRLCESLLARVVAEIHGERNGVKEVMNGFVIAAGCCVVSLKAKALAAAKQIGKVEVDMGDTACKVPDASEYICKVEKAGRSGKKRRSARC